MGASNHFAPPLVFRTPHPGLLGGNDFRFGLPRAWANICHGFLFPQPGQTNCLQYLLFVRCSAAVDNDEMAAWATDPPPGQEISACDLTKGTRDPESWCLGHDNGVNAHFRRHIFISFRLSAPPSLAVCPRITSSWLVLPLVLRRRRMKCNSLNFIVQRFPLTSPWVRLQFNLLLRQENLIYCPCTGNFSAELETHKNKSKNKSTSKRTQNHN